MKQPGIYILQSLKNGRYYIGSTDNIDVRYEEHKAGKVKSTKYLRPLKLCFFYPVESLTGARKLEYKLKKMKSKKLIEQIIKDRDIKMGD